MNDYERTEQVPVRTDGPMGNGSLDRNRFPIDDLVVAEDYSPGDYPMPFISMGYVWSALKRGSRVWCGTAMAGIIIGLGLFVATPPGHQAEVSLLLTNNPLEDPSEAIQTAATLAQSQTVAAAVVKKLGISETPGSFINTYSVAMPTTRVLQITLTAPSDGEATSRATTLATAFLQYRAQLAQSELRFEAADLNRQVAAAETQVSDLDSQIQQLSSQATTGTTQTKLKKLQADKANAESSLTQVQQYVSTTLATARLNTASLVNESQILDPATAVKSSAKKRLLFDVVAPLFGGLIIGMAIVIVGALISDRMRRRDDIAAVIGAPVTLSVASTKFNRGLAAAGSRPNQRDHDLEQITGHLNGLLPRTGGRSAGLVVVGLDNVQAAARVVAALALSHADEGKRVMVVDLTSTTAIARLLETTASGVRRVTVSGKHVLLAVPEKGDVAPVGPFPSKAFELSAPARRGDAFVADTAGADLVLTLATIDPAVGGDHLSTWASDAAILLTAGESSIARVRAAGEMARHAGTRIVSVVLMGADTNDETTGMSYVQQQDLLIG